MSGQPDYMPAYLLSGQNAHNIEVARAFPIFLIQKKCKRL
jgi:hypothetical protein